MTQTEILAMIQQAKENLKAIKPQIPCKIVVTTGAFQCDTDWFYSAAPELFDPKNDIFEPSQSQVKECRAMYPDFAFLRDKETGKRTPKETAEMNRIRKNLSDSISKVNFKPAYCELRFTNLNITAIQQIKKHPLVQDIGLTNMSAADIRIVVAHK